MALNTAQQDTATELLRKFEDINDFLSTPEMKDPAFGAIALRLRQHIIQDTNFLKTHIGNPSLSTTVPGHAGLVNPLTHATEQKYIMGKPVGGSREPVSESTMIPSKDEKAQFKAKVNDLLRAFPGMKDKDLMAVLSKPGGETLIRGVAKLAGVKDWAERESDLIDFSFFGDIRQAIKEKSAGEQLNASLEDKLNDNDEGQEEEEDEVPVPAKKSPAPAKKSPAPAKKAAAPAKTAKKSPLLDDDDDE